MAFTEFKIKLKSGNQWQKESLLQLLKGNWIRIMSMYFCLVITVLPWKKYCAKVIVLEIFKDMLLFPQLLCFTQYSVDDIN